MWKKKNNLFWKIRNILNFSNKTKKKPTTTADIGQFCHLHLGLGEFFFFIIKTFCDFTIFRFYFIWLFFLYKELVLPATSLKMKKKKREKISPVYRNENINLYFILFSLHFIFEAKSNRETRTVATNLSLPPLICWLWTTNDFYELVFPNPGMYIKWINGLKLIVCTNETWDLNLHTLFDQLFNFYTSLLLHTHKSVCIMACIFTCIHIHTHICVHPYTTN